MKIGELARCADCPVETIRYYEREGLLPAPARNDSNYRVYTEAHVARLAFIRHCRSLDMSHDEIRRLLQLFDTEDADLAAADAVLDEHIGHVVDRIAELQGLAKQLRHLRALCRQALSQGGGVDMVQALTAGADTRRRSSCADAHRHGKLGSTHD